MGVLAVLAVAGITQTGPEHISKALLNIHHANGEKLLFL